MLGALCCFLPWEDIQNGYKLGRIVSKVALILMHAFSCKGQKIAQNISKSIDKKYFTFQKPGFSTGEIYPFL